MSDLPLAYAPPPRFRRSGWLIRLAAALSLRAEDEAIRQSRRKLAEYDDRLLNDIGITREQAFGHPSRPAWAAPDPWLRRDR